MSDVETYDARVRAIRTYNQPILEDFRASLEQSGLAEKTVKTHISNIFGPVSQRHNKASMHRAFAFLP